MAADTDLADNTIAIILNSDSETDSFNRNIYIKTSDGFTLLSTLDETTVLRGPEGPQGVQGERGEVGPQGPQGI